METFIAIVAAVIAITFVNFLFRTFARIIGGTFFYSVKFKIALYLIAWWIVAVFLLMLFGA